MLVNLFKSLWKHKFIFLLILFGIAGISFAGTSIYLQDKPKVLINKNSVVIDKYEENSHKYLVTSNNTNTLLDVSEEVYEKAEIGKPYIDETREYVGINKTIATIQIYLLFLLIIMIITIFLMLNPMF